MVMGDERDNKQEVAEAPTNAHAAAYERLLEKQRAGELTEEGLHLMRSLEAKLQIGVIGEDGSPAVLAAQGQQVTHVFTKNGSKTQREGVQPPQEAITPRSVVAGSTMPQLAAAAEQLPPGWEQAVSAEGYVYYINHADQTTTYEKPAMVLVHQPEETAPIFVASEAVEEVREESPATELPHPWQELSTPEGEVYFYNPDTGTTQWEPPAGESVDNGMAVAKAAAQVKAAALDRAEAEKKAEAETRAAAEQEAETIRKEEEAAAEFMRRTAAAAAQEAEAVRRETEDAARRKAEEDAARKAAEDSKRDQEAAEDGLPPGWEKATTEEGYVYYINHTEQTTTYEKPSLTGAPASPSSLLPSPWQELSTDDGSTYFYNPETGVTQWEKPRL